MKRKIEDINKVRRERTFSERPNRIGKAPPIQKQGDLKVYSMDVSALYPSIQKDMASKAILEAVKLSNLEWKNLDFTKLVRYVALTVNRETLKGERLLEVVPKPKNTTTLNSFINPSKEITRLAG